MKIGTVKWFNPQKGYGFIHPDDGSPNVLVHVSAVESAGMSDLKTGQRVIFEISARRAHRRRVRRIVKIPCGCNDTACRGPFRHRESVRYPFSLHLLGNVSARAAVVSVTERLARRKGRRLSIVIGGLRAPRDK